MEGATRFFIANNTKRPVSPAPAPAHAFAMSVRYFHFDDPAFIFAAGFSLLLPALPIAAMPALLRPGQPQPIRDRRATPRTTHGAARRRPERASLHIFHAIRHEGYRRAMLLMPPPVSISSRHTSHAIIIVRRCRRPCAAHTIYHHRFDNTDD